MRAPSGVSPVTVHAPHALDVIDRVALRLGDQYRDVIDGDTVREIVLDSFRRYRHLDHPSSHSRSLAAQLAADRLDAVRWVAQRAAPSASSSFLFVCSGNAGRSQLAAALMRAIAPLGTRVVSAGESPAARVLPGVTEALDELGIAAFGEYPKPIAPEFVSAADHIVVLNCDDALDALAGHEFRRWNIALDRTSGKQGMRTTRDHIALEVHALALEHGIHARPY